MFEKEVQQSPVPPINEGSKEKSEEIRAGSEAATPKESGTTNEKKPFDAEKFAALARRQKAQLEAERRAKSEFERNQVLSEKTKSFESELLEGKKNPFEFMKKHFGLTYEDLTEMQLNDGRPTDKMEITSKLSELDQWKKDQEELKAKEKEEFEREQSKRESEEQEKQITEFKKGIPAKLEKNDKLDLVLALLEPEEQSTEVFNIIEAHWASEEEKIEKDPSYNPTLLSVDEAADILEGILSEKFSKHVTKSKKFGHLLKQEASPTKPAKDQPGFRPSQVNTTKTLTNDTATSPSLLSPQTERERMARAMSALGGS
jgi:hypothetical protein